MVDREKVITGLECCGVKQSCLGCPWIGIDCNDRLHLAALELLKEQPQWISVKDEMPAETHSMFYKFYGTPKWRNAMWREESDNVLVAITFEDGSQFVTSGHTQDGKWHTGISKMLPYTVTHWMPLPEPPEVKQE